MLITHSDLGTGFGGTATPTSSKLYFVHDIEKLRDEDEANTLICINTTYPKNGTGPDVNGLALAGAIASGMGVIYTARIALPCPPHCSDGKSLPKVNFAGALLILSE